MGSNNSKYNADMREQTVRHILESGKSATSVAEELNIDKNTVCRWVRDYRRSHNLPTHAEERGYAKHANEEERDLSRKIKELERELKRKDKLLREEQEKVEILKKSLHIFMQPQG